MGEPLKSPVTARVAPHSPTQPPPGPRVSQAQRGEEARASQCNNNNAANNVVTMATEPEIRQYLRRLRFKRRLEGPRLDLKPRVHAPTALQKIFKQR